MSKQSLSSGLKPAAKRATNAASYAVTQEAFDAAFTAGCTVAGAYAAAGAILQPLLAPLSGLTTDNAVAQWRELQRGFCLGMAAERSIDPDSARRQWGRLVDDMGLVKPQTEAAKAKQAARAKAAPADDDATPKDGAGAAAAAKVKMELSSIEAHIISLLRAGKREMAAQAIADMAE